MRVGLLTREFPPDVYGGAGVHVDFLARQLRERVDLTVLCMGAERRDAQTFVEQDPRFPLGNPALHVLSTDIAMAAAGEGLDTTHNLSLLDLRADIDAPAPGWSKEFDDWADRAVAAHDIDAIVDFLHTAPAATLAHPRTEHFAPLFVSLGASADDLSSTTSVIDGFWHGLSKRSWQFG